MYLIDAQVPDLADQTVPDDHDIVIVVKPTITISAHRLATLGGLVPTSQAARRTAVAVLLDITKNDAEWRSTVDGLIAKYVPDETERVAGYELVSLDVDVISDTPDGIARRLGITDAEGSAYANAAEVQRQGFDVKVEAP